MFPSSGVHLGYFRAYFGILRLLFEKRLICPHEILYRCSWCSFEFILGNVPLILHNCLIFSQETLYRCSWYNTLIVTNTFFFFFLTPCPSLQEVFWGLFWHITSIFENRSICSHEILYRGSWYSFEGN